MRLPHSLTKRKILDQHNQDTEALTAVPEMLQQKEPETLESLMQSLSCPTPSKIKMSIPVGQFPMDPISSPSVSKPLSWRQRELLTQIKIVVKESIRGFEVKLKQIAQRNQNVCTLEDGSLLSMQVQMAKFIIVDEVEPPTEMLPLPKQDSELPFGIIPPPIPPDEIAELNKVKKGTEKNILQIAAQIKKLRKNFHTVDSYDPAIRTAKAVQKVAEILLLF